MGSANGIAPGFRIADLLVQYPSYTLKLDAAHPGFEKETAMRRTCVTLISTAILLALSPGQGLRALEANGLQACVAAKAAQDNFSGVVAVEERDQPAVFVARGKRAGEESAPIDARSRFNLGSMSKMFTAVAVGQLIDAGKVRLDDPIGRYVGGLTRETSAVTIRQLLTHSGGLGDFFAPQNMAAMLKARTAADILPLIVAEKPAFAPGSRFAYSNSGFALLGILIERVSGVSYGFYLQQHLFGAAGMIDTGLDPKPLETLAVGMTAGGMGMTTASPPTTGESAPVLIGPDGRRMTPGKDAPDAKGGLVVLGPDGKEAAPGHQGNNALSVAPGAREGYGTPAGGLFGTAADMQRFAAALVENRLASPATTAALITPHIVAAPATAGHPERDYGFGFGVGTYQGHRWFGHNGGTLGANTEFAVFPDDRVVVTVLSNRDPPEATQMFAYVRGLVLGPPSPATCGPG